MPGWNVTLVQAAAKVEAIVSRLEPFPLSFSSAVPLETGKAKVDPTAVATGYMTQLGAGGRMGEYTCACS